MERTRLITLAILLVVGVSCSVEPEKTESEQVPQIDFSQGLGFYYVADGVAEFLHYPSRDRTIPIPPGTRFFSYGLDMRRAVALGYSLPPHLLGFGASYKPVNGNRRGTYAVHFVPVEGYAEPTYEIILPQWLSGGLREGSIEHEYFELEIPSDQAYRFRYAQEHFEDQSEKTLERMNAVLGSERPYEGTMTIWPLLADPRTVDVELEFEDYDSDTGTVSAILRDSEGRKNFSGRLLTAKRLQLEDSKSGRTWDLVLDGPGLLEATYSVGLTRHYLHIDVRPREEAAEEEEGDAG